ncbi:general secretion pathway protein GspE [Geomonas sp. RF6]|uniref:GspE/PulE/PilB domain-containing protein n=1 Tax=Geomonas sp. RF6 TaxID=2897342 RepID=UPI001E3C39AB|nr:general secretion pathway protein GspE [Geomonas sp. RF6]UFS72313.1 general secretion pathway protein GspE [Geomonas sp. RF6]
MAVRLGEMMLHAGMLTPSQLEEVLRSQAAFGGRLGTNLVEMGLIEERDLVRLLHEKLGVTCVDGSALNSVSQEVVALVPRELVIKHRVLPVALNNKRLTLAMVDPSDFVAIEEIGFVTGLVIVPCVATELSLSMALERYYGIKREVRYIPVAGGLRSRYIAQTEGEGAEGKGAATCGSVAPGGKEWRVSFHALCERLAEVKERRDVVTALLDYLTGEYRRAAFLILRSGSVAGVRAISQGCEIDGFSGYVADLSRLPFLQKAVQEKHFYLGELPQECIDTRLLEKLGGEVPQTVLFLPLLIDGEVVAFIYAEDRGSKLSGGMKELQQVAEKGALAFKVQALRKKIMGS